MLFVGDLLTSINWSRIGRKAARPDGSRHPLHRIGSGQRHILWPGRHYVPHPTSGGGGHRPPSLVGATPPGRCIITRFRRGGTNPPVTTFRTSLRSNGEDRASLNHRTQVVENSGARQPGKFHEFAGRRLPPAPERFHNIRRFRRGVVRKKVGLPRSPQGHGIKHILCVAPTSSLTANPWSTRSLNTWPAAIRSTLHCRSISLVR
jgi:hypothetical protein